MPHRRRPAPGNERHNDHELPDLAKVIGNKVLAIFPQAWCALPRPLPPLCSPTVQTRYRATVYTSKLAIYSLCKNVAVQQFTVVNCWLHRTVTR